LKDVAAANIEGRRGHIPQETGICVSEYTGSLGKTYCTGRRFLVIVHDGVVVGQTLVVLSGDGHGRLSRRFI
jgi:hypothetical protein